MIKTRFSRWLTFFTFAAAVALALPAKANTWPLPPAGSRLVGENKFHVVENDGGSLEAIAKKYNVGFLALLQANPGVDPYVPRAGSVLTIPLQTLLPDAPREGIVINIAELRLYYYPPGKNASGSIHLSVDFMHFVIFSMRCKARRKPSRSFVQITPTRNQDYQRKPWAAGKLAACVARFLHSLACASLYHIVFQKSSIFYDASPILAKIIENAQFYPP